MEVTMKTPDPWGIMLAFVNPSKRISDESLDWGDNSVENLGAGLLAWYDSREDEVHLVIKP